MAFWGVTSTDVTNCGWNLTVGLGVYVGCEIVAFGVSKIASRFMSKNVAANAGFGAGVAASIAATVYRSRFALVTDTPFYTMLKLGAVATAVGFAFDYFLAEWIPVCFTFLGLIGSISTRYTTFAPLASGLIGSMHGYLNFKTAK